MAITTATTESERAAQTRRSWRQSKRVQRGLGDVVSYIVIVLGAIIIAFPFYWQVATSLKFYQDLFIWPPTWFPWPLHPENYLEVIEVVPMQQYLTNSLILCTGAIVGTVFSCSLAAYGFARLRFPGRDQIFLLLMTPMILPGAVTLVSQFIMFQRLGWYNTYLPFMVPPWFGSAFYMFMLRQFFMTIPYELEDAARIDGAGFLGTYLRIILPMSKPALATVAIFTFMGSWNDFFGPLIYLADSKKWTLPLGLVFFTGSPRSPVTMHLLMAMATMIAAPSVLLYFVAQRMFIQGIVITGLKG